MRYDLTREQPLLAKLNNIPTSLPPHLLQCEEKHPPDETGAAQGLGPSRPDSKFFSLENLSLFTVCVCAALSDSI